MNPHGLMKWRAHSTNSEGPQSHNAATLLAEKQFSFPPVSESPVQRTVRLLRKHAWIVAGCTVVSTVASLLYSARQPRLYRATANIAIYRDTDTGPSLGKSFALGAGDLDDYSVSLETQLRILESRTLASATAAV